MQMISETADDSQNQLIGEGLFIEEQGIGYTNLAFEVKKGIKGPIFSFKPLKRLDGLKIPGKSINMKIFLTKGIHKKQFSFGLYD